MEEKQKIEFYQCTYAQYVEHVMNANTEEDDEDSSSNINNNSKEELT